MVPSAFDSYKFTMVPSVFDSSSSPSSPYQSSFTPPSSSPPTGLSPSLQSFTPPSTTRQRRTILVTMGPCNWRGRNDSYRCLCTSGSCTSDLDASQASCDNCMHPMSMHGDYAFSPAVLESASSHPRSRQIIPFEFSFYVNPRTELVDEIIARVQHYHIIQVRGTPASGKTTVMRLVANKLLEMYGHGFPIHTLCGWEEVKRAGWNAYLEQETGVRGEKWLSHQAYLLLDEAQESYGDGELWAALFKSIEPAVGNPFVILFSSYGSPGRGYVGFDGQKHIKTRMVFAPKQQISLRPEKDIADDLPIGIRSGKSTELHTCRPVGLLLKEDEAIDVLTRYASAVHLSLSLSADLRRELFLVSDGHVGLLTSLVNVLVKVPGLYALVRKNISLDLQTTSEHLFSHPLKLFQYISGSAFTRGLPPAGVLQDSATAKVFKKAIACDGIPESDFKNENELKNTLQNIWRNGWLHAEKSNDGVCYVFASKIHRWYCACLFQKKAPNDEIHYDTPLRLAIDAIMRFRPRQLSDAPRSLAGNTLPLEDQYQKEFYRCLFTILDGHVVTSPEYVVKTGTKGGTIDFLVTRKKWGLELLRDRDRLVGHMKRFEPGGQYFSMIQSRNMEQYIVLDFTVTQPAKPRPEYQGHLYHVVFSQNYREVEVIDASDLSIVESFALTENANPIV